MSTFALIFACVSTILAFAGYLAKLREYHEAKDDGDTLPYPTSAYLLTTLSLNAFTFLLAIHGLIAQS